MAQALTKKPASTRGKAVRKQKPAAKRRPADGKSSAVKNFRTALAFINEHTNYERMLRVGYNTTNFNLARMQRILDAIGNPHKKLRCAHIAGTKGKGSTCHMLAAMLQSTGHRVGLYTSPHIVNIRERIAINGQNISEADFTRAIARVAPVARRLAPENPTFFEVMTAAAFWHFAQQKVDFVVVETGLGGRLDSTNVIKPEVVGITNISFDHMAQLGNTLEAIAEEKAGIFKPGVSAVVAPQPPGVKRVFRDVAKRVGCDLKILGDDIEFTYRFESSRASGPHARICMMTPGSRFDHVEVPMLGEHQALNCGVALGMVDVLRQKGMNIPEQPAIDGLTRLQIPGRLETIREKPRTIVDCAHNAASIAALMRAIGQNISYDSMVVIFGCSADKDIDGMLSQLQLGADKVIFTNNGSPRSADPKDLHARFVEKSQKMAQIEPTLLDAYRVATHCVSREDLICITGSVYLVGLAKEQLAVPPQT
jgi:dihydrofolate synthase / folylpolyglutamate synthase